MPVKITDLLNATKSVKLTIGPTSIDMGFYVLWQSRLDDAAWDEAGALTGRPYFARVLPALLASWDLVDDRGTPVPITAKAISATGRNSIPLQFLKRAHDAVLADAMPELVGARAAVGR